MFSIQRERGTNIPAIFPLLSNYDGLADFAPWPMLCLSDHSQFCKVVLLPSLPFSERIMHFCISIKCTGTVMKIKKEILCYNCLLPQAFISFFSLSLYIAILIVLYHHTKITHWFPPPPKYLSVCFGISSKLFHVLKSMIGILN